MIDDEELDMSNPTRDFEIDDDEDAKKEAEKMFEEHESDMLYDSDFNSEDDLN